MSQTPRRPDHYATLGVARNADAVRIRDAYRALVRRHHPDLHPDDGDAEEALKRINEAYEVLSDPDKRRQYNLLGAEWRDILREEQHLRRTAGFAPPTQDVASSWEGAAARADFAGSVRLASARYAPILALVVVVLGIGVLAPRGPRVAPRDAAAETNAVHEVERALPSMRVLYGTLAGFRRERLEEEPARWSRGCEVSDPTDGDGDERRYALAAKDVAMRIDRAEADGLFALPLAGADRRVLGALLPLRAALEQQVATGCTNGRDADGRRELVRLVGAAERCLYRLSTTDARLIRAHTRLGRGVCR